MEALSYQEGHWNSYAQIRIEKLCRRPNCAGGCIGVTLLLNVLTLSKIKDEDLQREKIVNYLKKLYVEDLAFEAKKILFVFDGDLHSAKWNTKRQRLGSSIVDQAKIVCFN
jgi:hypothetical protein